MEATQSRRAGNEATKGAGERLGAGGSTLVCENLCESVDNNPEAIADQFARDFLIPPQEAAELPTLLTPEAVEGFAARLNMAAGIVVGRLQHERIVPWTTMAGLKRAIDYAWLDQGQQAMWNTWLSVTQAAGLLTRDLPHLDGATHRAQAIVSEAAGRGAFKTNCRKGRERRIEPVSFAAWRLRMRDRDLDAEEREEVA